MVLWKRQVWNMWLCIYSAVEKTSVQDGCLLLHYLIWYYYMEETGMADVAMHIWCYGPSKTAAYCYTGITVQKRQVMQQMQQLEIT
jgi:hypothetical protein